MTRRYTVSTHRHIPTASLSLLVPIINITVVVMCLSIPCSVYARIQYVIQPVFLKLITRILKPMNLTFSFHEQENQVTIRFIPPTTS
jgi:hypothetical protein